MPVNKKPKLPVVGNKAPDFTMSDQEGETHSLTEAKGKWVLLYFYPKDDTPGCTTEACTIRDSWSAFKKTGTIVWGVSTDSTKSHAKFATKYKLPFTLLADPDKEVVGRYGVWGEKKFMGRTYQGTRRTSFLIDPDGRIAKIYENVKPAEHAAEVLSDLKALKKTKSSV